MYMTNFPFSMLLIIVISLMICMVFGKPELKSIGLKVLIKKGSMSIIPFILGLLLLVYVLISDDNYLAKNKLLILSTLFLMFHQLLFRFVNNED